MPAQLQEISLMARSDHDPVPNTAEAVGDLLADPGTEGLLVLGTDAELASIAADMRRAGRDIPIGLVPHDRSDLLRMFGLDRTGIIRRLQSGGSYRVDLGTIRIRDKERPFVAHVAASHARAYGRRLRTAQVTVSVSGRTHPLPAWWVVVANAQHLSGAQLAPKSTPTDGILDIQVFGGSPTERRRIRRLTERGLHLSHRAVWRRRAASSSVVIPPDWQVKVDGVASGAGGFEVAVLADAFGLWI